MPQRAVAQRAVAQRAVAQRAMAQRGYEGPGARRASGRPHGLWARRAAVSRALRLDSVKAIEKLVGCTVNDVLLTCLAGALRDYLLRTGHQLSPKLSLRVVMPVDLRAAGDELLGTRFGLAFVSLPVGESDPHKRLRQVQQHL